MQGIKVTTAYKQALKGRILETAMKLFVEQGVKAVKMDDVAQALTISKRTLYELYKDKEELLYQGILQFNEKHRNSMLAFIDEAPTVMDIIIELSRQVASTRCSMRTFRSTPELLHCWKRNATVPGSSSWDSCGVASVKATSATTWTTG